MAGEDPKAAPGGDFSQDDIDALLSGNDAGGGEAEPSADADAGGGALSQADIDAAMAGGVAEAAAPDAGGGELSQADIDAAMAGGVAEAAAPDAGGGELSQADIDAAMAGGVADEAVAAPVADQRLDTAGRPFDEAAAAMAAAIEEEKAEAAAAAAATAASGPTADTAGGHTGTPLDMPDFTGDGDDGKLLQGIDLLHDVGLRVKIELGRTDMLVENVLKLGEGSVVELDKLAGDPVDVYANDRLIARGEVLVLNDNFCVRISEIVSGSGQMAARG